MDENHIEIGVRGASDRGGLTQRLFGEGRSIERNEQFLEHATSSIDGDV